MPVLQRQVLKGRYVKEAKLKALLKELFPEGGYSYEVDEDFYILNVPREITVDEQEKTRETPPATK